LLQGGELGHAISYCQLAHTYESRVGVKRDLKKTKNFSELAAIGGEVSSRDTLGLLQARAGKWDKAIKHFIIAAGFGTRLQTLAGFRSV
jgi:TPR repeat protein